MDIEHGDLEVLRTIVRLDTDDEGRSIQTQDLHRELPGNTFEELANAVDRLARQEPAVFQKIHLEPEGSHIIVGVTAYARDLAAQRD